MAQPDLGNYTSAEREPLRKTTANLGYQQITSLGSAVGLTIPAGAIYAAIRAEAQAVRWRDDGTNPTAAVGTPLEVGETLNYDGNLAAIKFIEQVGGAKLNVSYYR